MRGRYRAAALLVIGTVLAVLAPTLGTGGESGPTVGAGAQAAAPRSATLVIEAKGSTYVPATVTVGGGGTLTVVNLDTYDHTVTSTAVDERGEPLFDVRVDAGTTATVAGVENLANGRYDYICRFHPFMRGTLVVEDATGGVGAEPVAFEQPLVVPRVLKGTDVRIPVRQAPVRMLPRGPRTMMWTYGGDYPGPTILGRAGRESRVTFAHRLPRRAGPLTTHLHGDHHASSEDGQPTTNLIRRGSSRTYRYPLTYGGRPAPASFFFYHDHRMDRTARNNWRGLQGMFLVEDAASRRLRLPKGRRDLPLMISERSFTSGNALANPFADGPTMHGHHGTMSFTGPGSPPDDHTVGSHVIVNGRYAPYHRVSATRHRLRLLNAAPFTAYNLSLSDGRPFVQVGTGSGFLRTPVVRTEINLGPAQRADVVVDFTGLSGQDVVLESVPAQDERGTGSRTAPIMQFRVGRPARDPSRLPSRLPSPKLVRAPAEVSKTWTFDLGGGKRHGTFWAVNGKAFDPDRPDHRVRLGTTERWRLRNTSDMTHYVHIHAEQWRTVSRDGNRPPPWERALEDTWRLDPGEYVDVAARFLDHAGPFMIHCHMLDHEDHGMMARFDVVR